MNVSRVRVYLLCWLECASLLAVAMCLLWCVCVRICVRLAWCGCRHISRLCPMLTSRALVSACACMCACIGVWAHVWLYFASSRMQSVDACRQWSICLTPSTITCWPGKPTPPQEGLVVGQGFAKCPLRPVTIETAGGMTLATDKTTLRACPLPRSIAQSETSRPRWRVFVDIVRSRLLESSL